MPFTVRSQLEHMENMKAQLDLILLALEALTGIGSEAILEVAAELQLGISDRVTLWRLRQASPLRKGQGGRKRLDIEEARALVLIACHLARLHQVVIRDAVMRLEKMSVQKTQPHRDPLLGDYLDTFSTFFQDRMVEGETTLPETLTPLALKLLIDLLFYSGPEGHRRLWLALMGS